MHLTRSADSRNSLVLLRQIFFSGVPFLIPKDVKKTGFVTLFKSCYAGSSKTPCILDDLLLLFLKRLYSVHQTFPESNHLLIFDFTQEEQYSILNEAFWKLGLPFFMQPDDPSSFQFLLSTDSMSCH